MTFLMALLFSISCNLDNVIFGMSYGMSNVKISLKKAMLISAICTVLTISCLIAGNTVSIILPIKIGELLGAITLISFGIFLLIKEIVLKPKEQSMAKQIDLKNILYISIGLSLNNMPIAIASSIGGIDIILASMLSLICSAIFIYIGNIIGGLVNGKWVSYLASVILIMLGIISLLA